jgi:hypothetical protein
MRARALVFVVLLLSYGAVGARQPAVRMSVRLPVRAQLFAEALDLSSTDRAQLVLKAVRTLFPQGSAEDVGLRLVNLQGLVASGLAGTAETVPLPLDASIWRETILQQRIPDDQIIASVLANRNAALLYHGLAGLDDDTLAWLGAERDTLQHLLKHAGAFSIFGPSVRVRAGKVVVPGGAAADAMWQAVIGADPARPASFVRKLFGDSGHLAWFYDSLAQLDEARFRFATGVPGSAQVDRARALLDVFQDAGSEWRPQGQPFSRRSLDPAMTLSLVEVTSDGALVGPSTRGFWELVFADEPRPVASTARPATAMDAAPVDAPWLLSRIHHVPIDIARRRFEAVLFAQRMFPSGADLDPSAAAVVRARGAFPALMLTLERAGVRSVTTLLSAVKRADTLNQIGNAQRQRTALLEFQSLIGIVDRISRAGGLEAPRVDVLVGSLASIAPSDRGYEGKLGPWIRNELASALALPAGETPDPLEEAILLGMAGAGQGTRLVEWEGRTYRVSPERAEVLRLRRVRERQGGPSLTAALAEVEKGGASSEARARAEDLLAGALSSILYAAYLGDPDGPAVASGNVALKHDLATSGPPGARGPWRLPVEEHTGKVWRVSGSLLGLDVALARLALRRLDANVMPPEPRLVSAERQTAALAVALFSAVRLRDAARDEIASALGRGRARLAALDANRSDIDMVAADAGLSPWRRAALAWTIAHDRENLPRQLSILETMWLGRPRASPALSLDSWGAAVLPLGGCLCLRMPAARPWEGLAGRPALGLLATRAADVSILVADALASLKLPAELAPGVAAYAMQDILDRSRPSYFDDWFEFGRAASAVSRDTMVDYIAAQTAGGALLAVRATDDRQR